MGRKSLAETRRNEILDAFEDCIIKNGLDYCSLEQIAIHANMKRSIIRHYIGNKDEVLKAMVNRFIRNYQAEIKMGISMLKKEKLITELLKDIFKTGSSQSDDIIIAALWAKQEHNSDIKKLLQKFYEELEKLFADTLKHSFPKASKTKINNTAYVLLCLMDSHSSMLALGLRSAKTKTLYKLATKLVEDLNDD